MAYEPKEVTERGRFTGELVEPALRIAAVALLIYLAFTLLRPFATILIWSVVLLVAIGPAFERLSRLLGGHRRLAAALVTIVTFLLIIGPITWLVLGLIESLRVIADRVDLSTLVLPRPPLQVKSWPFVGERIYQFWDLAATNARAALAEAIPHLRSFGAGLVQMAGGAGAGFLKFLIAIPVAGFLFPSAPRLAHGVRRLAQRLSPEEGPKLVDLAATTIRNVASGVVGISALQAVLAGLVMAVAGVPALSLLTSLALIFGIIQIGPSIVIIPVVIWAWFDMETTTALLFTLYMVPVALIDNVLRPLVMGRGLTTPMSVILLGLIGGTIANGITGLFLGPIVLAVIWELLLPWISEVRARA